MARVTRDAVRTSAELFRAAGLGQTEWKIALDGLAEVTGSIGAQLIGFGREALVPFNLMTGVPPETGGAFIAAGGSDPAVNSRVRRGMQAAELEVLDESAFTTAADKRRNPQYSEWINTYDMHHTCLTNLVKERHGQVGLALLRTGRQGNVCSETKRAFRMVAGHARAAVRTQMALEAQGTRLLAGAMEAVRATAFFCDKAGRIHGATASAETMLSEGDVLRSRSGVLTTACPADRPALEAALGAAVAGAGPAFTVAARRLHRDDRTVIEVTRLPLSHVSRFGARALVIVHGARVDISRVEIAAKALYGLSTGEAAVAALLAAGSSPNAIARERGVSLGTVRTQVRRIYEKVGVASQLELAAQLPRL